MVKAGHVVTVSICGRTKLAGGDAMGAGGGAPPWGFMDPSVFTGHSFPL